MGRKDEIRLLPLNTWKMEPLSVTITNEAKMVRDKEDRDATVTVPHPPTPSVEATSDPILALVATINNSIDKIPIAEDESVMEAKQDTTFSLKRKVGQSSPNTNFEHLSTHSITSNTTSISHTPLVSAIETPTSSNHVSTNSAPADFGPKGIFVSSRKIKPSTKAKEMQLHSVARGHGNHNCGNHGRNRDGRG
ncbi:hypothetical protein HID58_007102 [Brassica napus]|uniref:Uncharacterized protein n=1 Tax=Brassica napus TaxID=3708 RepID=A0ABQ8EDD7_BRANA|nr:hypothetical protein HID58_007102 [Brassica napus]